MWRYLVLIIGSFIMCYSSFSYANDYTIADKLQISSIIESQEKGSIEALWQEGGQAKNQRGDKVVWGYFHANPNDVTWGSKNNPDVFVKIWFDVSGRTDVNFFHVSVPDVFVYSTLDKMNGDAKRATMDYRYVRHYYQNGKTGVDHTITNVVVPTAVTGNQPNYYNTINELRIGAFIDSAEKGNIQAAWQLGGMGTSSRGDQIVWGYFYADPKDVSWGNINNPDAYVKIWFDISGRIDVNFFHVSAPNIKVFSSFDSSQKQSFVTTSERYTRHEYSINLNGNSKQQAKTIYEQARKLEEQQKYADAVPLMKRVLALDPNYDFYFHFTSYLIRAANLHENSDYSYDEALQFATRAIALNPNEGRNYAEATLTAYQAQEFSLVQQYGEKAIAFGRDKIGNYYDYVTMHLELVKPYKYTITFVLNPDNSYVRKKDGLLYMSIPTDNLPYQQNVKFQLEGTKLLKQSVENGNDVLYVNPQTSPFQAVVEVTKIPYSYKKQLSGYDKNAPLPTDIIEYLQSTDMVDHNSAKVQTIAKSLKGNDDLQTVTNILRWLKENMTYAYEGQINYDKIDELIDLGKAQCGGYSDIFAALARANGISTRSVRGSTEQGEDNYFSPAGFLVTHSWNEFYLRNVGWIPVEPQRPGSIGVAYANYIRMGHYSMSGNYYLSPMHNLERLNVTPSVCEATCISSVKQAVSIPIP